MPDRPIIVVEDDPFLRLLEVVLDPNVAPERVAAFAHFMQHDEPNFDAWIERRRADAGSIRPADVRLVATREELRAALPGAVAVVVESLPIGEAELAVADALVAVQKFGFTTRIIDVAACAARGIEVLTVRRGPNIACAEHAVAMMLALARQLHTVTGLISREQLTAAGFAPATYDRRHTAGSNFGRVTGVRVLYGTTLGIIGMGEIGREIARRAAGFDMDIVYYQRTRLPAAEEARLGVRFLERDELLAASDWISLNLPTDPSTRHFIDAAAFARMKPGAVLVNVSRAEQVDRVALLDALRSGRLGGFALDPLYETPGRADDELLTFPNVIVTPHIAAQPRFNSLGDTERQIVQLARVLAPTRTEETSSHALR